VKFTPPAYDGGAPITAYKVQCASPNGGTTRTTQGTASPVVVGKLTPGKAYKCRVRAVNAAGAGAYSAYSARFNLPA
jgi:hypothetical protein